MTKKILSILCILCLLFTTAPLYAEENNTKKTFTLAGYESLSSRTWSQNAFFTRMEEKTGIHFEFNQFTDSAKWEAYKASLTANGELPDVLMKCNLAGSECITLLENGVLQDLKPYINQEVMPNLCALLDKYPEVLDAITLPSGAIAALPFINETQLNCGIWVNKDWMARWAKKSGKSMPETAEEFADMLRYFVNNDPNLNGSQDEIGLAFLGAFDLKFLAHAFGLNFNNYNIYAENGTVHFAPEEENFYTFVTWLRDLFNEGLLDPSGFITSNTLRTITDSSATVTYGALISQSPNDFLPSDWLTKYTLLTPLSYEGKRVYRDYFGHCVTGTFAVTTACTDITAVLSWVDQLYGEEGAILAMAGEQNIEYVINENNTWTLTDPDNSYYMQLSQLLAGGTSAPGYSCDTFQERYSDDSIMNRFAEYRALNEIAQMPFPAYTLTSEQEVTISKLQLNIGKAVDEQMCRWIRGDDELTKENYQSFINSLYDTMALQEFKAFWQDILNQKTMEE